MTQMYWVWVEPRAHLVLVADMTDAFGQKATVDLVDCVISVSLLMGKCRPSIAERRMRRINTFVG